mmetsp:Transcript_2786/g.4172  ORF Transcript_2786/g.4172 Transcript_2786/m.4172 type:complete len:84 (-) Transcript_2786:125-376(-)
MRTCELSSEDLWQSSATEMRLSSFDVILSEKVPHETGVITLDMLFATLDPTRVKLPGCKTHPEVLLADNKVGFIQKHPNNITW